MKINLPQEVVEFMMGLAKEIKTQDDRATASPYFFVVKGSTQMIAPDGYGGGETYYYHEDWGEGHTYDEWKDVLKQHDEEHDTTTDVDIFTNECKRFGMHDVDREENCFLTFSGYKQHMELNGHNYRHLKDVHSYLKYAGRNLEMDGLWKAIMAFDTSQALTEPSEGGKE